MQRIKSLAELATIPTTKSIRIFHKSGRSLANKVLPEDIGDKDEFGTLSERGSSRLNILATEKYLPEDADGYDKIEYDLEPRKNAYYYKYEITRYARQGSVGIRKALELFQQMKQKDRLKPDLTSFAPLIYGCAKAGYTKRAFELYEESLKYLKKPTLSIVTCLINACAESPFPEYGIERLNWFRQHLKVNYNFKFNKVHYNAAIKAYGKLGQLDEASKLVKEMIEDEFFPETDTFNALLVGCATNHEAGSTLALKVYKRMKLYEIKPDLVTYRLILRCIRDCEIGSPQLFRQTLGELPAMTTLDQKLVYKSRKRKNDLNVFEWAPLLGELGESIETAIKPTISDVRASKLSDPESSLALFSEPHKQIMLTTQLPGYTEKLPNLLSGDHLDLMNRVEAIQLDKLKNKTNRLLLFGGMHGFLKTMKDDCCNPDNKTFSLVLSCVKRNKEELLEYFRLSKDYSIKRDLLFYDLLIRHICEKFTDPNRLQLAQYFIDQMLQEGLRPNISTFESLAKGCGCIAEVRNFISDVERAGFVISNVMLKYFFNNAIFKKDFKFTHWLIELSKERKYQPTKQLVESLERLRLEARDLILKSEKNMLQEDEKPDWMLNLKVESFDKFNEQLGLWLSSVELLEEDHPWKQFHVKSGSRREGFTEFREKFKVLEEVKQDALEKGKDFGNLAAKANRMSSAERSRGKKNDDSHGAMNRQLLPNQRRE